MQYKINGTFQTHIYAQCVLIQFSFSVQVNATRPEWKSSVTSLTVEISMLDTSEVLRSLSICHTSYLHLTFRPVLINSQSVVQTISGT